MQYVSTLLLSLISLSGAAQAQDRALGRTDIPLEPGSRYIDERNRGDEVAQPFRDEFSRQVCLASLENFCPSVDRTSLRSIDACLSAQRACPAIPTQVTPRFISKYGKGSVSAHQDALPTIQKTLRILREVQMHLLNKSPGLPRSLATRVTHIEKISGASRSEIENELLTLMQKLDPQRLPTLKIDFWGYFQQDSAERHRIKTSRSGRINEVTLSFRWCGSKHRFVAESNRALGDLLALALFPEEKIPGLISAAQYNAWCARAKDLE